ncbi:hypothetical protein BGZ73_005432, partial [Actinomortierella ambigua]
PLEATFSFKVLRGCPKLQELCVVLLVDRNFLPYHLDVVSTLTDNDQDIFPAMRHLKLQQQYFLQPYDLKCLIEHALPGLETLHMDAVHPCTVEQVVGVTRRHPCLTHVALQHAPPDDAVQNYLGLVADTEDSELVGRCAYRFQDGQQSLVYRTRCL